MHRSQNRRSKWRRAHRGQVAAIATLFGLMILVAFIAEFVILPLPSQEQNLEFQHGLQVQNQIGNVQSAIARLGAASPVGAGFAVVEPVTLGSSPAPPFGVAASGQLWMRPSGPTVTISLPTLTGFPSWGTGTLCTTQGTLTSSGNRSTCTFTQNGCTSPATWNVSITGQSYYFDLKGNSGSCQTINVTGDHNFIMINETANNMAPPFNFTLFGSNNTLVVNWEGGQGSQLNFALFGSYNTFQYGTLFNGKGATIVTKFIGEKEPQGTTGCPYTNLASTDKVKSLHVSSSGNTQSLTFYNSIAVNNGPHTTMKGGEPTVTWQNISQAASQGQCAFMAGVTSSIDFPQAGTGILAVTIQNNYLTPETVAMDGGAVVVDAAGNPAVLVNPPLFTFSSLPSGPSAALTVVRLVGNPATEEGGSTAGIGIHVLSSSTLSLSVGAQIGKVTVGAPQITVNTSYPMAWWSYFQTVSNYTSGGVTCAHAGPLAAPYTCLNPPPGTLVTLTASLNVASFSVTVLVLQVNFY